MSARQAPPRHFGFEVSGGVEVEVEAYSVRDAIDEAEASTGQTVIRGRCLDDYDESTGRSDIARRAFFDALGEDPL